MFVWERNNTLPRLAWLALLLVASAPAGATILTVGASADADCDYDDIQAAIDALPDPGPHEIRIANSQDYSAQAIKIVSLVVTLRGGFEHCADATASGGSVLSGEGGGEDSVLTITGTDNNVILEHLSLIRGDEVYDGYGGGIDFRGAGTLTLRDTVVYNNYAGYGGGVSFSATGGYAELRVQANTYILLNTAQFSGGGIRAAGDARVKMHGTNSWLQANEAIGFDPINSQFLYGYGGGIEVIGPARADISTNVIDNTARYGGGIAVIGAGDDGEPYLGIVRLFATDANKPVRISDNRASQAGGGIWLKPNFGFNDLSPAILCAYEFRIDGNHAQQGSAIYADTDAGGPLQSYLGSGVRLNSFEPTGFQSCGAQSLAELGGVVCATGIDCNTIAGNIAENANGQATAGAAIMVQTDSSLIADRIQLRDNRGAQAIRSVAGDYGNTVDIVNSLIVDNLVTGNLIRTEEDNAHLNLENTTIAGNDIAADTVLSVHGDFVLRGSILWQPGKTSLSQSGGTREVAYVVTSEESSLNSSFVVEGDPRFEDPADGDYRLIAASPAIDYAPAAGGTDIEGKPRDVDIFGYANGFGPSDAGAYERQSTFSMVRNHGFDTDFRLWDEVTPGVTTWEADGAGSVGAVLVSGTPNSNGDLIALRQCVRIPGPGTYELYGYGKVGGFGQLRDSIRLSWKLRPYSADESCNGAITAFGELYLPGGNSFAGPAQPALIEVSAVEWTYTTVVEIKVVVNDNGVTFPATATGWFDDITLEPVTSDVIFADGFDGEQ